MYVDLLDPVISNIEMEAYNTRKLDRIILIGANSFSNSSIRNSFSFSVNKSGSDRGSDRESGRENRSRSLNMMYLYLPCCCL